MREKTVSRFGGNLVVGAIILGMVWFNTAGIYYCFKYDGVGDRVAVWWVPPYTWYKSLEFSYRLLTGGLPYSGEEARSDRVVTEGGGSGMPPASAPDHSGSIDYYRKLAEQGDSTAQYNMGAAILCQ